MPTYHRSQRLRLVGTGPKVEQLQEGRFRLTFTCTATNPNEAWMNGNKDQIMTTYGTLQSAQKSIAGIDPRTDEAYSDMVLFRTEANPSERDLIITLVYETATTSFVKSQDDKIDFDLNGLQRVTRITIAKTGTSLPSVTIGATSITVNSTVCKLATRSVEENDAFIQITETYLEEGTVSEQVDNVGSQEAKVITTFGSNPSTPSGYSLARKDESNFEGLQTNTFTFLRRDSLMSSSEDFVGSQKAIVEEWFDPTDQYIDAYIIEGSDPAAVADETGLNGIYYLIDTTYNGKVRYSRSTPATLEYNIEWTGSQWRLMIQATVVATSSDSGTHPPTDVSSWTIQASGYAFKTITRENVSPMPIESSETADFNGSIQFDAHIRKTKSGYSLAKEDKSNTGGIPTERYTFLKPSIISRTDDKQNPACPITIVAFDKDENDSDIFASSGAQVDSDDYVLVSKTERDFEGIETFEMRFEKRSYFLKESENQFGRTENVLVEQGQSSYALQDMPGDAATINGTANSFIVAQEVTEGVVAKRVTTYSTRGIIDVSEDLIGATRVITISKYLSEPGPGEAKTYHSDGGSLTNNDFILISDENQKLDGVDIFIHRYAIRNSIISTSFDPRTKTFVVEKFGPTAPSTSDTINTVDLTDYTLVKKEESNVDGLKTYRYTFLKPTIISVSQDFVKDVNTIQVTAFDKTEAEVKTALTEVTSNHKLISQKENDHDGIVTTTYVFEINTSDEVAYTSNNKLQVTRTIYEAYDYDYNANYDVGTSSISFQSTTLMLTALKVDKRGSSGTFVKLIAVYLEQGEASRIEKSGPTNLPGTEQVIITSSGSTPVTLTETNDIKLISKQQQNGNGFATFVRTYLKGIDGTTQSTSYTDGRTYKINTNGDYSSRGGPSSGVIGDYFQATSTGSLSGLNSYEVGQITGTKLTYDSIISVKVPGTVKCGTNDAIGTLAANVTNNNKSQATLEVVPPNAIKIKATVTESIETSVPSISTLAYNLDNIACSVLKVNTSFKNVRGPTATTLSGGLSTTGFNKNASLATSNSYYPGSYILDNDNDAIAVTAAVKGKQYRIISPGDTNFTTIGAADSAADTVFIATGAGTGTGTVRDFGSDGILTYQCSSAPKPEENGFQTDTGDAETDTSLITKGTTSQPDGSAPSSYTTTGVIQQKARPVLTTIDGTTYYEVIKFSKS